jgi:hypothetical protein
MALQGTLKDFGIAEILQLIGQQAKSGVLHLSSRDEEIHIAITEGCVVRAEHAGRKTKDRLGTLLVRAEVITQDELDYALDVQKRTLRRLGDILVELGFATKDQLRETTALQTTETIYKLFHWKSGTYQFVPGEVEWDAETAPRLRAESVLMEGFRQVDEWPMIRRRITSTAMTFERLKALDSAPPPAPKGAGKSDDVDAAFDALGEKPEEGSGEFASLGANEQRVYDLAVPGRPVEKIVDLSRLGEFETCKALLSLLNLGYLEAIAPARGASKVVGAYAHDWQARLRTGFTRAFATLAIAAALAALAVWVDERGLAFGDASIARPRDNGAQRFLARFQMARLRGALEVYRLEKGDYPARRDDLVEAGLASGRDLHYPWEDEYYYRRGSGGRFVLLPPVE